MRQESWGETVANGAVKAGDSGVGCLLQIHPLEVNGHLVELPDKQTAIGRDPACGMCIPDASVSRQHALIERTGDVYYVTDLGSTNGLCVNEQRVHSTQLSPGDRLQIGGFIFKFLSTNHIEMQYHEAVYSMMTRDGLTETLNKRSFMDIVAREFQRSVHRETDLSLILFDIDHFKAVNDTYGHLAGDDVLQEMGRRVGEVVAEHDVFARYGGEEFAILLADVSAEEASVVAERCRKTVEETDFLTSAGPLKITVSLGVADMKHLADKSSVSQLIKVADRHLYIAKDQGRNQISTAGPTGSVEERSESQ